MVMTAPPKNVDAYIAAQPEEAAKKLEQLRQLIKATAPAAEETISYSMPAYKYHGMLVYFAAWANHYGFYPGDSKTITELFEDELKPYDVSKGTIRFPYNKPMPVSLIKKIVKERMKQNEAKAAVKATAKKDLKQKK